MIFVRITMAGERGPTAAQIDAIRAASYDARRYPLDEIVTALDGVHEVVLAVPEPTSVALEVLENVGLRPERIVPRDLGGVGLWAELGFEPLKDDEHRWTFRSRSAVEVVVSAIRLADTWEVEVRRPREPLRAEGDWPGRYPGAMRRLVRSEGVFRPVPRAPLAPPQPRRPRPEIDVARGETSRDVTAEVDELLRRMRAAPRVRDGDVLDGTSADICWMSDGVVRGLATHEPVRDDVRGTSLLLAAIAVATAIDASPTVAGSIRIALFELALWARRRP